jgi:hypothetical protein
MWNVVGYMLVKEQLFFNCSLIVILALKCWLSLTCIKQMNSLILLYNIYVCSLKKVKGNMLALLVILLILEQMDFFLQM